LKKKLLFSVIGCATITRGEKWVFTRRPKNDCVSL
jgi:hypothetical protein